ncbi:MULTISPECIES: MerR family transcriptional regulator [Pantoea]|jgi:DNA-binding transcriptional MerR regulator|uniref:Transcriptional regulator n=1 Tax=Pantoea brenneri TaxID=472694 RepID=A0A653Z4A5_9GAMM|nr:MULTISPECIES: MerR family transcriptional regulator [Pantoea]KKD31450.1 transcriptional regulator [Pantoea sp. 3.5.1]MBS6033847.1 MerR family transcriptional regulator [Pantoea sp.]MBZ6396768.1 MerR family transcriptional regulator [Pantoea sp.]MBZ6440031.1 MerR family transcriptional regulator [Pantoea sp.]MDH2124460.1 MerR family transcriptional regulator [Pantoea brenneri]
MYSHTTETVCAMTGTHPANLKSWMKQGLLSPQIRQDQWSDAQLSEVRSLVALTATGATLQEIKQGQASASAISTAGWTARKGDMLWQLEFGTPLSLSRQMHKMSSDYSGDDFIFNLLRPLSDWLRADRRQGAVRRLGRFQQSVQQQADKVMRASSRSESTIPLFLEAVSVRDETEIWLEAIRLSAMGFNVDVASHTSGEPAVKTDLHQHHVMWCGAGISQTMQDYFEQQRQAGEPVMLSGPDRNLHYVATLRNKTSSAA